MNIAMPPGDVESWRSILAVCHMLAIVLFVAVIAAWGRHEGRWRLVASGFVLVAAATLTYLLGVRPSDIPNEWLTVLHHGLERKTIFHLYAKGAQAGPNFAFVLSAIAGAFPQLHDVVWLNLLLALVNALLFFHVAVYRTGRTWAFLWTLVFALNPATFLASFSELPGNLLGLYLLAGVIAWASLYDPLPQPIMVRAAAFALCVLLTLFAALTRVEVAAIGTVALALHTGHALVGSDSWSAASRRLATACRRPLVFFSDHLTVVGVLCVIGWGLARSGIPGLVGRSQIVSVYPFYPAILSLFPYLLMLAVPLAVSIACLFGFLWAVVEFRRFGGLALSLAIIANVYFAAWFEYFEMGRYFSYVSPVIFVLGLFGQEKLHESARSWSMDWGRAVRIGYVMAWFSLPLPGVLEYYVRPEYHRSGGLKQLLLDRDTQREVRHLVALSETNPRCVFVARVIRDDAGDPKVATEYLYVLFGAPLVQPIVVPEAEAPLADVIAQYASGTSCVRLYYGSDCNLSFADHCEHFIAGRQRLDEFRFRSHPYNNPLESGYGPPEIVLATYEWP